ncbi:hypothetical protein vseg_011075 [Gypsophila vaccaria]
MAVESGVQSEEDKDKADVEKAVMINGTDSTVLETGEDESEDEDVDFNPFMKGSPSEEASSSLSSEVEGVDVEVVSSCREEVVPTSEGVIDHVIGCMDDKFKEDGQVGVSCEHEQENVAIQGVDIGMVSGNDVVEDGSGVPLDMIDSKNKSVIDFDEEDAICRRTRARYSLASFTLDELETFLQETDDEDDFQNVDEEEEYKKFLAAVLSGGDGDDQGHVAGNDEDDDDEDNDADFEIEIEEALESDVDDCVITSHNDEELGRSSRRPKTRQKRRPKPPASSNKGIQGEERPLRPLIPVMFSAPDASVPCLGANSVTNPSHTQSLPSTGFVTHQIGQLYCLIYEHVQLLIQVYSLSVLEPSRQHIAAQVKGLLSEMLHKRDLILAWRNVSYPSSCFVPQDVNTVSGVDGQNCIPDSGLASGSDGEGCRWLPPIGGPVLSVLDVEPLKLAGNYMDDVSNAVRDHQKRCVETTNYYSEKQPLFPHPVCPSPEVNCDVNKGEDPAPDACAVSSNQKVPKKTLAATLVESTKKQSLALVPQQIARLAEPFYPLFNPSLFPHKPPSPAVANRVLFTDAEDVLLATGIMEYNNDWKSIQQRFLPCKSEHQIFVRAKNRCSSKAPDNPIKTVRKLKTSPLTEDEKARIEVGLKTFKLDWTLVWRTIVPYRDPNLLPRQWRIAIGTQKSYKMDSYKKEKHRIYELDRRNKKAAVMDNSHCVSEEGNQIGLCGGQNRNREGGVENDNEAFVHEAFLADWRPNTAGLNAPKIFSSDLSSTCPPGDLASSRFSEVPEIPQNNGNKETQSGRGHVQVISVGSENTHHVNHKFYEAYMGSRYPSNVSTSKSFGCGSLMHSQRGQKPGNLVKLAPDLPPVKLPPAVRVISQASFRSSQLVSSTENSRSNPTAADCVANLETPGHDKTRVLSSNSASVSSQERETLNNKTLAEDRGADSDPQMHPLLFRSLEDGHAASYPVNSSSIVPTFSFFPALQRQMGGSSPRTQLPAPAAGVGSSSSKETSSTPCLNFHPLLQRTSDFSARSPGAGSINPLLTTDLELSRDGPMEELIYRAGADAAELAAASRPSNPNSDANDVDLGIHLSSSRKRKISVHEDTGMNRIAPSVSERSSGEGACRTHPNGKVSQHAFHHLSAPVGADDPRKSGSDNPAVQLDEVGGGPSSCTIDNVCDPPLLEIVMEQEELSDSDEEMENVEFECEEMTDSDGEEGSAAEQIVIAKRKVNQDQEKATVATDINAQCSNTGTSDVPNTNRNQRKGRTAKADSVRIGTGSTKGSWLCLNSRGSHQTEQAGVTPLTSQSNKHSKKATTNRKKSSSEQKTESPGLDPLPSSSRKHRKQVVKTPSNSKEDIAVVSTSYTEKDGKV